MTERDDLDDLTAWADDDLVRALRAPGTATELADQDRYVAAFREAGGTNVRSLPRRAAGRLGAGGTAVVVTVALTSGVAAAYTGNLPDPVQRVAHSVLGAPAPDSGGHHHTGASGTRDPGGTPAGPGTTSSPGTASAPPSSETSTPSASGTDRPVGAPSHGTTSPSDQPSSGTTTPPATSSGGSASAMTMSAPAHRVGWGETLTLTGLVTDASGNPLAGHTVVLQVRGPRHWRAALQTTSDASGLATATTPGITRSTRFRWKADRGIASSRWLVRMVPDLSLSADAGGSRTTLSVTSAGTRGGDRFQVFRHLAGRTALVRRGQVDATGSAALSVLTPRRHAAYVVRLLPTRLHAATRARVRVVPPAPAALSSSASALRVGSGSSVVISGTVVSAGGEGLPGHRVVLQRRGPARWKPVGHAVTDGSGHVSIATPAVLATSRFRLRTDHRVVSTTSRVVEVPTVTASAQRGAERVTVSASTVGTRAGDRVVLLRRAHGRLVRLRHARLDAGGSVTFAVRARATRTAYVVKVVVTRKHGAASDVVTVPGG